MMVSEVQSSEKKPRAKMTPRLKAKLVSMWKTGDHTHARLAEHFEISESYARRITDEAGAKKGATANKISKKVEDQLEKQVLTDAALIAQQVRETKEQHYRFATAVARITHAKIAKAVAEGGSIAVLTGDLKALQIAAQNYKICLDVRFEALGYDPEKYGDDDTPPELVIHELTQEDIEAMQKHRLMGDDALDPIEDIELEDRIETDDDDERVETN